MTDRALRIRIGILLLLALVLLAILATLFGNLPSIFRRSNVYYVEFVDAPTIASGTPVRRSGVRIGQVDRVDLDDETGMVRVTIRVEKRYTLRNSEQPTLVVGLLGGDSSIDFLSKKPEKGEELDRSPIAPGAVLTGFRQPTVGTLVSQASEVVPTTQELLNDIRKSLRTLENLTPLTEETIREYRDLARTANKAAPKLLETNDEIQKLVRSAREGMDDMQAAVRNISRLSERLDLLVQSNQDKLTKTLDNLNEVLGRTAGLLNKENQDAFTATLKNIRTSSERFPSMTQSTDELLKESKETLKKMRQAVDNAEELVANLKTASKPLADRSESITKNVDQGAERLNKTLADLNELLRVIGEGDGTLRRFIADPALYNHLDELAVQITKLVPRINRMLGDLETFADKLARHPESLGLGGVVRPSSGIKDVPSSLPQRRPPN